MRHCIIEVDDYLISREHRKSLGQGYFDLKQWFKLDHLSRNLKEINEGADVIDKPQYDHSTGQENEHHKMEINRDSIVIIVGIFSFDESIRKFADLNILVDADKEVRLRREIKRNQEKRGVPEEETITRFHEVLDPTFQKHLENTGHFADIVIDNN